MPRAIYVNCMMDQEGFQESRDSRDQFTILSTPRLCHMILRSNLFLEKDDKLLENSERRFGSADPAVSPASLANAQLTR